MKVIFCDSVVDHKTVDPDYLTEWETCKTVGASASLISYEDLTAGNALRAIRFVTESETIEQGVYRGWMLTPEHYMDLYEALLSRNIRLINSPEEYKHCHYLPESYSIVSEVTPKSVWTENVSDEAGLKVMIETFNGSPVIVKDYVKSEKHNWEEACYIPDTSNWNSVKKVLDRFIELRGNYLNKGVVFRKFEKLKFLTNHSKSEMPLTKEFRVFFKNGTPIMTFNYWEEGDYGDTKPVLSQFLTVASNIKSNFFTMDIAQKENGEWIIMELGDGQVAGIPDESLSVEFYKAMV